MRVEWKVIEQSRCLVILLIERRPLERRDASKTKVMESVGESETFLDLEISIGVPLAT